MQGGKNMSTDTLNKTRAVQLIKQNRLHAEFAWIARSSIEDLLHF